MYLYYLFIYCLIIFFYHPPALKLRWYGHVLRKADDDWVKKCMEYEVEGPRPRGRRKRTWTEVVEKDCQAWKLNKEDAVDRSRWRKLIKAVCIKQQEAQLSQRDRANRMGVSGWMFLLVPAYPGSPRQRAVKRLCVHRQSLQGGLGA